MIGVASLRIVLSGLDYSLSRFDPHLPPAHWVFLPEVWYLRASGRGAARSPASCPLPSTICAKRGRANDAERAPKRNPIIPCTECPKPPYSRSCVGASVVPRASSRPPAIDRATGRRTVPSNVVYRPRLPNVSLKAIIACPNLPFPRVPDAVPPPAAIMKRPPSEGR